MTDTDSIDWKVARFGALSALAGSAVGAVASLGIAWWTFEHEDRSVDRATEERVYVDFMTTADSLVYPLRYDGLASSGPSTKINDIVRAQNLVLLYGSDDVKDAAAEMVAGIADAISTTAKTDGSASPSNTVWKKYDRAHAEFIVVVQDDLAID